MKTTCLISLLFITGLFKAQTWLWAATKGSDPGLVCNLVANDPSDNIFITGIFSQTLSAGTSTIVKTSSAGYNIFLMKYDQNGNGLWAQKIDGYNTGVNSVCSDPSGNSFITGFYGGGSAVFGSTTLTTTGACTCNTIYLAKYSPTGNLLWVKSSGGVGCETAYGSSTDATGNIYITGVFTSSVLTLGTSTVSNPGGTGKYSFFIAKIDPNGNTLWLKSATTTGTVFNPSTGMSITSDPSGNSYVAGEFCATTITFGTTTLTKTGSQNIFVVKYNSTGNVVWAKAVAGSDEYAGKIDFDGGNNLYLCGSTSSPTITMGTNTLSLSSGLNMFIAKFDINGNSIWGKGSTCAVGSYAKGLSLSANSTSLFVDMQYNGTVFVGGNTYTPSSSANFPNYLLTFDTNGNLFCDQEMHDSFNGCGLSVNSLGDCIVASDFNSPLTLGSYFLPSSGETILLGEYSCLSTNINTIEKISDHTVFPNPSSGIFTIHLNEEIKDGEIVILNELGHEIKSQKMQRGDNLITSENIIPGLYFYQLKYDNGIFGSGKIIFE